jgi:hypothetical protein
MVDDDAAVGSQFDIEFDGGRALLEGQLEGCQRIFGGMSRCAAMGKIKGMWNLSEHGNKKTNGTRNTILTRIACSS